LAFGGRAGFISEGEKGWGLSMNYLRRMDTIACFCSYLILCNILICLTFVPGLIEVIFGIEFMLMKLKI
jgi:hypothetical protein